MGNMLTPDWPVSVSFYVCLCCWVCDRHLFKSLWCSISRVQLSLILPSACWSCCRKLDSRVSAFKSSFDFSWCKVQTHILTLTATYSKQIRIQHCLRAAVTVSRQLKGTMSHLIFSLANGALTAPLAVVVLTFPFCHETVSLCHCHGLSPLVRSCSHRRGLMCSHWLVIVWIPRSFQGKDFHQKKTKPLPSSRTHLIIMFCSSMLSQAETKALHCTVC